ncbi:MAG TPA: glyoxalase [Agrobacterium sp.]|uniref:VOC family protein n=1 Tax=Agrobacterium pusense TaxID=648995 RepID=UPI000E9DC6CB|nr:glyoxalase [Agrobacterium sp.]
MTPPPFDQLVTFLFTDDLDASAHFYGSVLELPLALDQGACRIYSSGSGFVAVCSKDGSLFARDRVIITLVTEDVDGWYEHIKAKGVAFEKPPAFNSQYNVYNCFLRDPAGYLIEIQRFLDPSWPKASR